MTNTYLTGNPLGSTAPKDLYDNASNFDEALNSPLPSFHDRFNMLRQTWSGIEADFDGAMASFETQFSTFLQSLGYEAVHLTYVPGSPLVVDRQTQLIDYLGSSYRVKTPATFPVTLTGTWATDSLLLLDVGDAALRSDLANTGNLLLGAAMVARGNQVVTTLADLRALSATSPSKYVVLQGENFISPYTRDDSDISSPETLPLVVVATDGARYKLIHNGTITAEQCGLVGDGVTINTSATLNAANAAVTSVGATLQWGPGTYICENISIIANQCWHGVSQIATILKSKDNLNTILASSNFAENVNNVTIKNIQFNGNRANNSSGGLMGIKGAKMNLENLIFTQAAGSGLTTDFDVNAGFLDGFPLGFESTFTNIVFDTIGGHGWVYAGPTDSAMTNITFLDCGVLSDNTYYGLWATRNFRGDNLHPWNRATTTNTPASSVLIDSSAPACTVVNSHFEGGHTPLKVLASGCVFTSSAFYAPRAAYCIENYGLANQFQGQLGSTAYDLNPDFNGILCAGGNSRIDLCDVGCRTGAIDFTGSLGGNTVDIVGWRATGIPYFGTPAASDDVNLLIGGAGGGQLVQQRRNPMKAVNYTIAAESGVLTNATASGVYTERGSMLSLVMNLVIINNGSGASALLVTVPWVATRAMTIFGYENITGKTVRATIQGGTSVFRVVDYTNAYAGSSGMTLQLNGEFERN